MLLGGRNLEDFSLFCCALISSRAKVKLFTGGAAVTFQVELHSGGGMAPVNGLSVIFISMLFCVYFIILQYICFTVDCLIINKYTY